MVDFVKMTLTERELGIQVLEEISDRITATAGRGLTVDQIVHNTALDYINRDDLPTKQIEMTAELLEELSDRLRAAAQSDEGMAPEQVLHHLALDVIGGASLEAWKGR